MNTIALLISPGIAGLIYTYWGIELLYVINGASFLIATFTYIMIDYPKSFEESKEIKKFTLFQYAMEGYKIIAGHSSMLIIIFGSISYAIIGRFYDVYKVFVAEDVINISAEGIIFFSYSIAIGSILAPFMIRRLKSMLSDLSSFVFCNITTYIFYIMWVSTSNKFISIFSLFFVGLFSASIGVFLRNIIQKEIDPDYIGRVFSFYKITVIFSAIIGILIAPILYEGIGIPLAICIISLIGVVISIYQIKYINRNPEET